MPEPPKRVRWGSVSYQDIKQDTPPPLVVPPNSPLTLAVGVPEPGEVAYIMHPGLMYLPGSRILFWDMTRRPALSIHFAADQPDLEELFDLNLPVTHPPIMELEIVCGSLAFWGPLRIRARPESTPFVGITLKVLFDELYKYLHRRVTPEEYAFLKQDTSLHEHVKREFYRRCDKEDQRSFSSPDSSSGSTGAESEVKKGLKRVDYLTGYNQFAGMTISRHSSNRWQLYTSYL